MSKPLFCIYNDRGHKVPNKQGQPMFFGCKMKAKAVRDKLSSGARGKFFIGRGPAHVKGVSHPG